VGKDGDFYGDGGEFFFINGEKTFVFGGSCNGVVYDVLVERLKCGEVTDAASEGIFDG